MGDCIDEGWWGLVNKVSIIWDQVFTCVSTNPSDANQLDTVR